MNTLQGALRYSKNTQTSVEEITAFANELLAVTWEMKSVKGVGGIYNLRDLGWSFELDLYKSSVGLCSSRKRVISISQHFFNTNMDKSKDWEDTLRHEIAHALDHCMRGTSDHSEIWKMTARQVLCDATRTTNAYENCDSKYLLVCPNCQATQAAHKVRTPTYACKDCCTKYNGGKFSAKYIFKFINNPTHNVTKAKPIMKTQVKISTSESVSMGTIDFNQSRQQQVETLLKAGITDRKAIAEALGLNYSYLTRLLKIIENKKQIVV